MRDTGAGKSSILLQFTDKRFADNINIHKSIRCSARIRSNQEEAPGTLKINGKNATYIFDSKIASTSPGQACVFYLKDQVLGGGWITKEY